MTGAHFQSVRDRLMPNLLSTFFFLAEYCLECICVFRLPWSSPLAISQKNKEWAIRTGRVRKSTVQKHCVPVIRTYTLGRNKRSFRNLNESISYGTTFAKFQQHMQLNVTNITDIHKSSRFSKEVASEVEKYSKLTLFGEPKLESKRSFKFVKSRMGNHFQISWTVESVIIYLYKEFVDEVRSSHIYKRE